ncbi:MAG: DUF899 family protein [Streptomyces sp.]|nr:DUF899 family protein [Streptomyces sp.]NUS78243.1 DUF899 family protein [Streptomyces sp.]
MGVGLRGVLPGLLAAQLLVEERWLTRGRDAPAAGRRRMPWLKVDKAYECEGPDGRATLRDLFRHLPLGPCPGPPATASLVRAKSWLAATRSRCCAGSLPSSSSCSQASSDSR